MYISAKQALEIELEERDRKKFSLAERCHTAQDELERIKPPVNTAKEGTGSTFSTQTADKHEVTSESA